MKVRNLLATLIAFALTAAAFYNPQTAEARKIKTKHSISKKVGKERNNRQPSESCITLNADSSSFNEKIKPAIRFYGFDKTVGSNMESFFISNGLDLPIEGMELDIIYSDMKGRQLHRRKVRLDNAIPSGETIRQDIKSWDTQKSFYFYQSAKPKRQATPFNAKIELISVTLDSLKSSN